MFELVASVLAGSVGGDQHGLTGAISAQGTLLRTYAAFEVATLDLQGQVLGRPVVDLLGGPVRSSVPYSAYLFYKWAGHPGASPDRYGEVLDAFGPIGGYNFLWAWATGRAAGLGAVGASDSLYLR